MHPRSLCSRSSKDSCTFLDLRLVSIHLRREYAECAIWRDRVLASLDDLRPDLVFVASSRWVHPVNARDNNVELLGAAMARLLVRVPGRVVIIGDTPLMYEDVPACLSQHVEQVLTCATMRGTALAGDHMVRDRIAAERSGAHLIDPTDWLCDGAVCPAVVDGKIVYHDDHHLTATFVRSLARLFAQELARTYE